MLFKTYDLKKNNPELKYQGWCMAQPYGRVLA
jgi:hypothetical protein